MALKFHGVGDDEPPRRRSRLRTTLPRAMILITLFLILVAVPVRETVFSSEPMPMRLVPLAIPATVVGFAVAIHLHLRRSGMDRAHRRAPRCRLCDEIQDPSLNPQWRLHSARTCPECGCPQRGA